MKKHIFPLAITYTIIACVESNLAIKEMINTDTGNISTILDMNVNTDSQLASDMKSTPIEVDTGTIPIEGDMAVIPLDIDATMTVTVDIGTVPIEVDMGDVVSDLSPLMLLPNTWTLYASNPVVYPSSNAASQGLDNIYAPHIMKYEDRWWMWYGGQGIDGDDAIFLAWSDDLVIWSKHGGANPIPVVDHGTSNHVNDPSVVNVNGTFYMYYTEAPIAEEDEIHLATSDDGIVWQKRGVVINTGADNSWESDRVGRPSVLYENGVFRMWYDGQIFGVARHVGYATSDDGFTWTKYPNNPIVLNEGAIDVARLGSGYVMLAENHTGTRYYTSSDRVTWQSHGFIIETSGSAYDQFGQVTPHLLVDENEVKALFYGGATQSCWCKNRIAVAFPEGTEVVGTPQGCQGCLQGLSSCVEACEIAGFSEGVCAEPNSIDPNNCCACANPLGCSNCLQGFDTCREACQSSGFDDGVCAVPGSHDPSRCCACN